MSKHHDRIKNDPRWKQARADCLARDEYRCVQCGSEEELEADHILELALYPDLAFDVDNLRTLCRPCHELRTRGIGETAPERMEWVNPKYADALTGIVPVVS